MTEVDDDWRNEIKPIDPEVSHRICSGQVIVTLSTAVKELVENSLDAGASSVEIRLVDSGSKLIQVKDNGSGVAEKNFPGLARKHCTSKLREFEDLDSIGTFGFRGEALSSLCALSDMTVTTRTKESKQGFEIEYNQKGEITKLGAVARQQGTTITLHNIFSPLPVRHKEFLKHLKREFNRMVTVLYGYSIAAKGVRISCVQESKGSSSNIICVPATESTKERIASVFGSKQVASLTELEEEVDIEDSIAAEFGLTEKHLDEVTYNISGWISEPNSGRGSTDRQFYFVNSRPWDSPKIARLVNEVYHTFSRSQFPFVFVKITTKQENVDVNVTPDKRSIFLQNEKLFYAKVKATLLKTLSKASSQFSSNKLSLTSPVFPTKQNSINTKEKERLVEVDSGAMEPEKESQNNWSIARSDNKTLSASSPSCGFDRQYSSRPSNMPEQPNTVRSFLTKFKFGSSMTNGSKSPVPPKRPFSSASGNGNKSSKITKSKQPKLMEFMYSKLKKDEQIFNRRKTDEDDEVQILDDIDSQSEDLLPQNNSCSTNKTDVEVNEDVDEGFSTSQGSNSNEISMQDKNSEEVQEEYSEDYCNSGTTSRLEAEPLLFMELHVGWQSVLTNVTKMKKVMDKFNVNGEERSGRKFRAKILPDQNSSAEQELKQSLSKDMFKQMGLIGQFNLGFIIAKHESDIFIVDQHAADEKYNYEDLEKRTVLEGQRLIKPIELQLPAVSENILMENLSVFQKNGFSFNIKTNAEPTKRVSLTKIPYSKSCQFGKQDVEELIYMLEDAPEKNFYRPLKVKTMLASRACRKSVMIGDRLNFSDMRRVVGHLGEIEQPWNCPHGRPTLRHLFNLNLLPDPDWFRPM